MASSVIMMMIITTILIVMVGKSSSTVTPFPSFLGHVCSNTSTYDINSTFQTNLDNLLKYLSSNASTNPNGFYSTSVGRTANDTAYGFFMCRGDLNISACSDCVAKAVMDNMVTSTCPRSKIGIIYYEKCMLRYDDQVLVGTLDLNKSSIRKTYNEQIIATNQTKFKDLVLSTIDMLSARAKTGHGKKYATAVTDFETSEKLNVLVQCVPDLTVDDCNQCLEYASDQVTEYVRQGWVVYVPSCNFRYELYTFFDDPANLSLPSPPSATTQSQDGNKKVSTGVIVAIIVSLIAGILILVLILRVCFARRKSKKSNITGSNADGDISMIQSIQYDLHTLQSATDKFSEQNKLGQGGFGAVYKGILKNGQEIAVKKLSTSSTQGLREFKNEALLIAKLQHRNLVKLLGFCVAGEEKLLVYEFVAHKSLDHFLFDPVKKGFLDWEIRYKIIQGIARGMLYLHQDSRLTIIHRDLKASNILLDTNMNPKISGFGLAKVSCIDQTQGSTSRIAGTFGYMAPEYAMRGQFSTKSDVYSFGVIVLEIISGEKNSSSYQPDKDDDLLIYAWKKWNEGNLMELVDPIIRNSCSSHELMKCIHLGLLCVQESVSQRPTMATVIQMLDSTSVTLPVPEQPSITLRSLSSSAFSKDSGSGISSSNSKPLSVNGVSITQPEAR